MAKYKIADVVFEFNAKNDGVNKMLNEYAVSFDETAEVGFAVTKDEMERERCADYGYPDWYLESLALFRKLCVYLLDKGDGIIFHASAICIDNKAYLFTAPSGTGKSTHARFLREKLGERAFMINDDKPIVRKVDGEFFVYGTPWNGKHRLSKNCKVKIDGICKLYRANENVIEKADTKDMIVTILNQTLRFPDKDRTEKLLSFIDGLISSVKIYALGCKAEIEAADVSYNGMVKGEENEN